MRILTDCRFVVDQAHDVRINQNKLEVFAGKIALPDTTPSLLEGLTFQNAEHAARFCLFFNAMNFCFWQEPRPTLSWNGTSYRGSKALLYALYQSPLNNDTALAPIAITAISQETLQEQLQFLPDPLFSARYNNLIETATILSQRFAGEVFNMVQTISNSAGILVENIVKYFPSFDDKALYKGQVIRFHKRAQLLVHMLSEVPEGLSITDLDVLTAFADYKIPQLLHGTGILDYSEGLKNRIDNHKIIVSGSSEEVEIRATTIIAVDLLQAALKNKAGVLVSAATLDAILWQEAKRLESNLPPHHRTISTYY